MMIDNLLLLSSAQAITTTAVSTSVVDASAAADVNGKAPYIEFLINTAFTSNGATVQFELQTATDEAFSSPITLFLTGAIAVATLIAGYRVARFKLPLGVKRYIRANYTVASGPAAAGKVDCRIVEDVNVLLP